jgi:hypothetical protein
LHLLLGVLSEKYRVLIIKLELSSVVNESGSVLKELGEHVCLAFLHARFEGLDELFVILNLLLELVHLLVVGV